MENGFESSAGNSELLAGKVVNGQIKRDIGLYGYIKETDVERHRHFDVTRAETIADKMSSDSSRNEIINRTYDSTLNATTTEAFENLQGAIFSKYSLYDKEMDDKAAIRDYVQSGLERDIRELSYEYKMADSYDKKKKSKSSNKRLEKRKKAWEAHKEATLATGTSAAAMFNYNTRMNIGDVERKALYEYTKPALVAKQKALVAMKDADAYDIENNIKMARNGKKRAIDMGDGTTKFFQKLAKIRSDAKSYDYSVAIGMDYSNITGYIPKGEKKRFDLQKAKHLDNVEKSRIALEKDLDSVSERIPDLLQALNPNFLVEDIKPLIPAYVNSKDYEAKRKLVDIIMSEPAIVRCIRRDLKTDTLPTSFNATAQNILNAFLAVCNSTNESSIEAPEAGAAVSEQNQENN